MVSLTTANAAERIAETVPEQAVRADRLRFGIALTAGEEKRATIAGGRGIGGRGSQR